MTVLVRALFLALPLMLVLSGCSSRNTPQALFDDYLWRLGNVTTIEPRAAAASPVTPPPRLADRRLAVQEFDVALLDMVSLQRCGLGDLVGKRNSSLGKVMRSDGLLHYELRFLARAQSCISGEDAVTSETLRATLSQAVAGKRSDLPRRMWNAVFADADSRLLSAAPPLSTDGDEALVAALQSLRDLDGLYRRVLEHPATVSDAELAGIQVALQRLARNESFGAVIGALELATGSLQEGTRLLEGARREAPFCPDGRAPPRAGHMHNVFTRVYIGEVQPYLGRLYRDGGELLRLLQRLDAVAAGRHQEVWSTWRQRHLSLEHESGAWQRFEQAMREHTASWQGVLEDCGLRPGA